jgi:Arylsulfotransferase (ASST)
VLVRRLAVGAERGCKARNLSAVALGLTVLALSGCAVGSEAPPTNVTSTSATFNGGVASSANGTVSYWFAYGKTASYGSQTPHRTITINERTLYPVSEQVGGLDPASSYHYQVCAQHPADANPTCSADESFSTQQSSVSISAQPALFPNFDPQVSDYVTRCGSGPVTMTVAAQTGTQVSIDGQPARGGSFTQDVPLAAGQGFSFSVTTGGLTSTFHVRCLPDDFPSWTFSRSGQSSLDFALIAPSFSFQFVPSHYLAFFDTNGVPVWWYKQQGAGNPLDAKLLPDNTVAYVTYPAGDYQIIRLDGTFVRSVSTVGTPTDFHELQLLPNGDFLLASYRPRDHVDLSPYGGPSDATVQDAEIQEVAPNGSLVWSWNSKDHIALNETGRWWPNVLANPFPLPDGRNAYDVVHINAIEPDGNGLLISLRHTDAVYRIARSDGHVEWKLGGTTTPQSLTVRGDNQTNTLGGQHDVRRLADGTVTVHDNGTNLNRPPRALRFQIDPTRKTATLLEKLSDPDVSASACCGSATKLQSGDWLLSWGGQPVVAEYPPGYSSTGGPRVMKFDFSPYFSYRAFPLLPGRIGASTLRQAMDAQFPR